MTMSVLNRVERRLLRRGHPLFPLASDLCGRPRILYNQASLYDRQNFIRNETTKGRRKRVPYSTENSIHCAYRLMRFTILSSTEGCSLLPLRNRFYVFWKRTGNLFSCLYENWKKASEKDLGRPKLPHYKKRKSTLLLKESQARVKERELRFCRGNCKKGSILPPISTKVVRAARLVPQSSCYVLF